MTELSYNDVVRAAADGVRTIRSELQKIAMQTQQIAGLQRSVQTVQTEIYKIEQVQGQSANIDQKVLGLINDMQDLRVRVGGLEKLCQTINQRLQIQFEDEEVGYRSV